jgi:hypothetical protein
MALRWYVNLILIGIPFGIIGIGSIVWDVAVNMYFNRMWAEGNIYLMANTFFTLVQGWNAVWIMIEIPIYLRH